MKKLTILTIVIVLLALATPAMSDVVFSGKVKYGVCLGPNTDDGDELTSTEKTEARLTVVATPDDNNTVTLTLKLDNAGLGGVYNSGDEDEDGDVDIDDVLADAADGSISLTETVGVDEAKFDSNLLGAFGLGDIPVAVILTGGYFEAGNKDVGKVSKYELEDVINTKNKAWQFGVDVGIMDMVTIRVAIDPTWQFQPSGAVGNADTNNIGYLMGAFGGAGPVMAEVFYANYDAPYDEPGQLGIGVGVGLAVGVGVGVSGAHDNNNTTPKSKLTNTYNPFFI